jgi:DNA-binding transcriptional LysR family regulator
MDWDHTRIFLAVARSGQFLAAARHLHIDHATVSRRISQLETSLGTRLFDRHTQGCLLTPAGEHLLASAERVEAEILRVQADFARADPQISGTVRIGAPDGFGNLFLSARLGILMQRHPQLTLQLVPVSRSFSLSKREADIAISIDEPERGRLYVRKLTDYTLRHYASAAYLARHGVPKQPEALKNHTLATYVQDLLFSPALNFVASHFDAQQKRFECASAIGQIEAVRAGAGIGILHDYLVRDDQDFMPVLPELVFNRAYWIVTHADMRDMLRVKTVVEFIIEQVGQARHLFA